MTHEAVLMYRKPLTERERVQLAYLAGRFVDAYRAVRDLPTEPAPPLVDTKA